MQVIIFTNENGGVSTTMPTGEISIEAVMEKDIPQGRGARIVNITDLPTQHDDFYDAWEMTDTEVTVNLNKAKEITKNRLRIERTPLLQVQDIAFQRANETGADTSAIVAEKTRLRDITKLADSAATLDELKAIAV
jgi:hypothetical protein